MLFDQAAADVLFNNSSKLFCFCCFLTPQNFTQNFLGNALIEILKILQTWIQIRQVEDPVERFPELFPDDK